MLTKVGAGAIALLILVVVFQGHVFGGGGAKPSASIARPSSIPTATPPVNLPAPILLGQTTSSASPGSGTGNANVYVVKSGDSLDAIAGALGVPDGQRAAWIAEVLRLNGIADARLLSAGVELSLPRIQAPPTATRGAAAATTGTPGPTRTVAPGTTPGAATPRPNAAGGGGTYTVQSGDSPIYIAQKFCAANPSAWADQLLALNDVEASRLSVGQVLDLPAGTQASPSCSPPVNTAPNPTATPVPGPPPPSGPTPTLAPLPTNTPAR